MLNLWYHFGLLNANFVFDVFDVFDTLRLCFDFFYLFWAHFLGHVVLVEWFSLIGEKKLEGCSQLFSQLANLANDLREFIGNPSPKKKFMKSLAKLANWLPFG